MSSIHAEREADQDQANLVKEKLDELLAKFPPDKTPPQEFWGAQYDLGLAWVHFPAGMGGLGLSPALNDQVASRLRSVGAPNNFARNPIGIGMGAPTVATYANRELAERVLRPMFTTEEIWCQLFSEPNAGSDVAALATRAERDGDEWVVTGQKVWTTLAHISSWGMLVTRTDPNVPKHNGLTYFIVDMRSPGVEVRPLRQMTGEAEFNEVYFNGARIPDAQRLGEVGKGWSVAITTLMNERVSLGGNIAPRGSGAIAEAVRVYKESKHKSPGKRDELMKLWVRAEVNRLTTFRAGQARKAGNPGPEGSVGKLASAELNQEIYNFCIDNLGAEGLRFGSYEMTRPELAGVGLERGQRGIQKMFLRSRANSIEGGTSEIMRNILGERVLGLPGEPRGDKDLPWNEIPKN
ncbi:MAG: acyl-CoA dehydrogenase family protein [Actinomycetota bacterium]|nr:acyl-CoA dehydrogenase family protein [Actinomycetota bacterium]